MDVRVMRCVMACIGAAALWVADVRAGATVIFLDIEEAREAIVDDSLEPYFDRIQPMEMAAKTGSPVEGRTIEEQRAAFRERYRDAALAFTEEEREVLRAYVEELAPVLAEQYPRFAELPWAFLKVSNLIEGGLPHTRGTTIIFSDFICRIAVMLYRAPDASRERAYMLDLLVHEQMHVFQRVNPGFFDTLYEDVWGFEKAGEIESCDWITAHQVTNPDAVECPWVLPVERNNGVTHLWPLIVFREGDGVKRMPDDFRQIAVSLRKDGDGFVIVRDEEGVPVHEYLMFVPEFRALFPYSENIYHPDEASADEFAKLVMWDHFVPTIQVPEEERERAERHFDVLREWFERHFSGAQE